MKWLIMDMDHEENGCTFFFFFFGSPSSGAGLAFLDPLGVESLRNENENEALDSSTEYLTTCTVLYT